MNQGLLSHKKNIKFLFFIVAYTKAQPHKLYIVKGKVLFLTFPTCNIG
jgi:hypothetical protein